jgi:type IV secretion system protein VirB1
VIAAALLACAANIAPVTLEAVIEVESRGDPLLLHVNGLAAQPRHATDASEAAGLARRYIAQGYSVDLGLMQVNSRNLAVLGYTIEQVLADPCINIRAGAAVLTADYAAAMQEHGDGQAALQAALSAYNTGDLYRGFANGYVARYYGPGSAPLRTTAVGTARTATVKHEASQPSPNPLRPTRQSMSARRAILRSSERPARLGAAVQSNRTDPLDKRW